MDYYSDFITQFVKNGTRISCTSKREAFSKQITFNTIADFEALFNANPNVTLGKISRTYNVSTLTIKRYYSAYKELRKSGAINEIELRRLNISIPLEDKTTTEFSMCQELGLLLPKSLPILETEVIPDKSIMEQLEEEIRQLREENDRLKRQNETLVKYVEPLLKSVQAELDRQTKNTALQMQALIEQVDCNTKALLSARGTVAESKEIQEQLEILNDMISQGYKEMISKSDLHCMLSILDDLEKKVSNCLSVMDYILKYYDLIEDDKYAIGKSAKELWDSFRLVKGKWQEHF